jgi:DNA modification methylase
MPKLLPLPSVDDPFGASSPSKRTWSDPGGLTAHLGNCLAVLPTLPSKSAHCCVTSPPYWGLRDYRTALWIGGDQSCGHVREYQPRSERANPSASGIGRGGDYADEQARASAAYKDVCGRCGAKRVDEQLGAEPLHDCGTLGQAQCGMCYVCNTVRWCREVRRVLRDDGVFWLNIGDTYAGGSLGSRPLVAGNLVGIPWRAALALQADGWVLRSECPWFKRNSMPESAINRPGKSLEYVFMLVKQSKYFFDMDAVRQSASQSDHSDGRNFRNSDLWLESATVPFGLCGDGDDLVGLDVTINPRKID